VNEISALYSRSVRPSCVPWSLLSIVACAATTSSAPCIRPTIGKAQRSGWPDSIVFRLGGPQTYLEERGHPRLRGRHMPFSIGEAERDRWLELMGQSMREAEIPAEQAPIIGAFFAQIADVMRNREG